MKQILAFLASVVLLGVLAFLGWRWVDAVAVESVTVRGAVRANPDAIVDLAAVSLGTPILEASPEILADRVRRHPWVKEARVSRRPTGTIMISVRERKPVALALDSQGSPGYYMDAEGFRMPVVEGPALDVPILRGSREPYHPVTPIGSAALRELMGLLVNLDDIQDALLSEIHETKRGELEIYTAISPAGQSIRVRLGKDHFEEKLNRLHAFWMQAVLPRPSIRYDWVDLRFDGQVVTRERA